MNEKFRRKSLAILMITIFIISLIGGCSSKERNNSDMPTTIPSISQPAATQVPEATSTPAPEATPTIAPVATAAPTPVAAANDIDTTQLFSYDSTVPFNVTEVSSQETPSGVTVKEISYDAYDKTINTKGTCSAYVVMPKGDGPFPCILYFHWLGNNNSNKNEFLEEAKSMADQGIAGVLIDGYFPWKAGPSELKKDISLVAYQVIEVRRAIDYMVSLPKVDKDHLGYIGHDYGSMFGSVVSGVDKRISCYVIMAGMGNFSDWFLQYWGHTDDKDAYIAEMSQLDPVNFVKNAAPAKLFFQFADNDGFISKKVADAFYATASDPKEEKFYDTTHAFIIEEAKTDRDNWMIDNLKQ